ncbi:IS110 family transposase [Albibacterium sp.]|uniref:IS110 family transposase n=1 Tax=Albibacterium sp. TaxID=2952885 RepID=UPI002C57FBBE|nr:IS110 family transposase [Albibacterium sp.]HUH19354.1 IS110 family transposase [Albibacterium sp.]
MHCKTFVGIDVSKSTFDAFIHGTDHHKQFPNLERGFESLCKWIGLLQPGTELKDVHVSFEHTGLYSLPLAIYLEGRQIAFSMINALQIKRSSGLVRGKNDKIDAKRIAEYAYLHREKMPLTKMPSRQMIQLQPLLALRDRLVRQRAGMEATRHEQARFLSKTHAMDMSDIYDHVIDTLKEQIQRVDAAMKLIIELDPELKLTFDLITGIKGVGKTVAIYLIVYTHNFTRFATWRKFACYAGVAPFENQSGTTYLGKTKVSSLANKQIKKMLHLAALSASRTDAELHAYFVKRVQGGKSKMATLNIIRNKILSRVFAVAMRKSPYVDIAKYAA